LERGVWGSRVGQGQSGCFSLSSSTRGQEGRRKGKRKREVEKREVEERGGIAEKRGAKQRGTNVKGSLMRYHMHL
jgi:hypothetical protein